MMNTATGLRLVRAWAVAALASACVSACAAGRAPALTPDARRLNLESFDYVWSAVRDRHFDPTLGGLDWNAIRQECRPKVERARTAEEVRDILTEMVGRLKLSHFQVIPAELYESGERPPAAGIGGTVGIDARVVDGHALVTRVTPASSAAEAGVMPGWELVGIEGADIRARLRELSRRYAARPDRDAMLAVAVRSRLFGAVDTGVAVTALDGQDRRRTFHLKYGPHEGWTSRPVGHIPAVPVWLRSLRIDGRTGYVTFNAFIDPGRLMPRFNEAMASFLDADGVVIDLRGNTGGIGNMLAGMAGWFIATKGTSMGTVITRSGSLKLAVVPRPKTFAGSVAVLVDELSMSASEVLAQGLKDAGRARVFGCRSAGAVLASVVERLPNGDGFQYPTARFEFPSGVVLEGRGVVPDVEVRPTRETLLSGRDAALDAAVQWIRSISAKGPRS